MVIMFGVYVLDIGIIYSIPNRKSSRSRVYCFKHQTQTLTPVYLAFLRPTSAFRIIWISSFSVMYGIILIWIFIFYQSQRAIYRRCCYCCGSCCCCYCCWAFIFLRIFCCAQTFSLRLSHSIYSTFYLQFHMACVLLLHICWIFAYLKYLIEFPLHFVLHLQFQANKQDSNLRSNKYLHVYATCFVGFFLSSLSALNLFFWNQSNDIENIKPWPCHWFY